MQVTGDAVQKAVSEIVQRFRVFRGRVYRCYYSTNHMSPALLASQEPFEPRQMDCAEQLAKAMDSPRESQPCLECGVLIWSDGKMSGQYHLGHKRKS